MEHGSFRARRVTAAFANLGREMPTTYRKALALALVVAGCEPAVPLVVVHHQPPAPATCELSQSESADGRTSGTFDLVIGDRDSYVLTPLVRNHTGTPITITNANVTLEWEMDGRLVSLAIVCPEGLCRDWDLEVCDGGVCPVVPAGGSASFPVSALPRVVTAYFQSLMDGAVAAGRVPPEFRVVSHIVLEGTTSEGLSIASEEYEHELRVCLGCLVEFPPGSDSPDIEGPDCCGGGEPLPACLPGQDDPVDCRRCVRTLPEICNFGRLSCAR